MSLHSIVIPDCVLESPSVSSERGWRSRSRGVFQAGTHVLDKANMQNMQDIPGYADRWIIMMQRS